MESVLIAIGAVAVLAVVFRITGMNYFKLEIGRDDSRKQLEK